MKTKKSMQDKINDTYNIHKNEPQELNNMTTNDNNIEPELEQNQIIEDKNTASTTELEQLLLKNAELEDILKRKVAEFDNYKKRTDKERLELLEYGNAKLFTILVDLLDDLRNAKDATQKHTDIAATQAGIEMIYQKADKLFGEQGVTPMNISIGDEFDVNKHEALMRQESELEEGLITMIIQPGYLYKDKVIRYAKVATSNGNKN